MKTPYDVAVEEFYIDRRILYRMSTNQEVMRNQM